MEINEINDMRARNRMKQALQVGRVPLGMELMLGSERMIEIIGWSGFDYIHLDQEHAPFNFESIESFVRAADSVVSPRLSGWRELSEGHLPDTGGGSPRVVIPQVRDAADVRRAISAMYYEPHGARGMCPVTRSAQYNDDTWDEYLEWVRAELMIMPLIENKDAAR